MSGSPIDKYEVVIGLEVHAQLLTESKLFCGDSAAFGGQPNTHVSPVTLAHPGTLPRMNKKAVEYAIRLGLTCGCSIETYNYFARKNYFYPDLPKGYQISQHTTPICAGGYVPIRTAAGSRNVQLNRIHMEEDAGKSIHDLDKDFTCIDLNRAGVPLLEIVSEPDLHSGDEAYAYLTELRKLVRYLEICDGNMEEGSMRCDANISIRLKGETQLGTKVEVKNLNSIRNVKRAIEWEVNRLVEIVESGGTVIQETRSYDASNGTTFSLRTKEEANDYRYFPDPDLTPFHLTEEFIDSIQKSLPELPEQLVKRYITQFQLPEYDARIITEEKEVSAYFEAVASHTTNYKAVANWLIGPVKSWMNESGESISSFPVSPERMALLIALIDEGKVNFSVAQQQLLPEMMKDSSAPVEIANRLNLIQEGDADTLKQWVEEVMKEMPEKVLEFRKGKKGLIGLFVGEVKKKSKGKADPKRTNEILLEYLNQ